MTICKDTIRSELGRGRQIRPRAGPKSEKNTMNVDEFVGRIRTEKRRDLQEDGDCSMLISRNNKQS